jgi:hypothetical protein
MFKTRHMKKIVLIFLLLLPLGMYAGGNVRVKKRRFILLPFVGGIWQRTPFGELAIGHPFIHYINYTMKDERWHNTVSHGGGYIVSYVKLGAEFAFNFNHGLWAPKATGEVDYKYFCLRANVEDYSSAGQNNCYFSPEAGFTLSGFITVTGGYNEPLVQVVKAIPPYRISISLMLPFAISGAAKNKN